MSRAREDAVCSALQLLLWPTSRVDAGVTALKVAPLQVAKCVPPVWVARERRVIRNAGNRLGWCVPDSGFLFALGRFSMNRCFRFGGVKGGGCLDAIFDQTLRTL